MAYIIAIANEKGGVAKTTTAVSLGAALVEAGQKVLLVDLDPQANLSMAVGIEPVPASKSIMSVFQDTGSLQEHLAETGVPGLDIIPAAFDLGMAERFLPIRSGYETLLRRLLRTSVWKHDTILLDCPPFLGALTLNALSAADMLIMPTQAEYFSVSALRTMMGLIRKVRNEHNPQLLYRLLLTMYDRRNRIHRTLAEQLRVTFGNGVLETVIEVDTRLRESAIAGLPIIYHSPHSRSALQYRALSQEILTYVKETSAEPA